MVLPVAALSVLLALISDNADPLPRQVRERAKGEGWIPEDLTGRIHVPRLWFAEDPSIVPPPFVWPSDRGAGVAKHPGRTIHLFLSIDDFLRFTGTADSHLDPKQTHMRAEYLEPAQAMMDGRTPAAFPVPWLELRYDRSGDAYIGSHEGRHRALLARDLGLPALPVVLVVRHDKRNYEHTRDREGYTLDRERIVEWITRGGGPHVQTQYHGPHALPVEWKKIEPLTRTGRSLSRELIRLGMTLDPNRNR